MRRRLQKLRIGARWWHSAIFGLLGACAPSPPPPVPTSGIPITAPCERERQHAEMLAREGKLDQALRTIADASGCCPMARLRLRLERELGAEEPDLTEEGDRASVADAMARQGADRQRHLDRIVARLERRYRVRARAVWFEPSVSSKPFGDRWVIRGTPTPGGVPGFYLASPGAPWLPARLRPGTTVELSELGLTYEDGGARWLASPRATPFEATPVTRFGDLVVGHGGGAVVVYDPEGSEPRVMARYDSALGDARLHVRADVVVAEGGTGFVSLGLPHLVPRFSTSERHYLLHTRLPLAVVFSNLERDDEEPELRVADLRTGAVGPRRLLGADPAWLAEHVHDFHTHSTLQLAFLVAGGGVAVWNLDTGKSFIVSHTWSYEHDSSEPRVAFTADGSHLCVDSAQGKRVVDVRRRKLLDSAAGASVACPEKEPASVETWLPLLPPTSGGNLESSADPAGFGCVGAVSANRRWLVTSPTCATVRELERVDLRTGATTSHELPCTLVRREPEVAVSASGKRVAFVGAGKPGIANLGVIDADEPGGFCDHGALVRRASLTWIGDEAVAMARQVGEGCEITLYDLASRPLWTRSIACPGERPLPLEVRDGMLIAGDATLSVQDGAKLPAKPQGDLDTPARPMRARPTPNPRTLKLLAGDEDVATLLRTRPTQMLALLSSGELDIIGDDGHLPAAIACQIGPVVLPFAVCENRLLAPGALTRGAEPGRARKGSTRR